MRILLLAILAAACLPLAAQSSDNINGSIPSTWRLTLLYEVDFGSTSQGWSMSANLQTGAASGLVVRLIDVDGLAGNSQVNPTDINESIVTGPGTANAALSGTYSGVHCFAVEIETENGTTASDYNGSVTVSTGTLSFVQQDEFILPPSGLKVAVGKFAFWNDTVPANTTIPASLELDFGPTSKTIFIRLEGAGTDIEEIEFLDTTGGSATVLATFTNPGAGTQTAVALTHSGEATIRVNTKASATTTGTATWSVSVPCEIFMSRVGLPEGGGKDKNDCSTSDSPGSTLVWLGVGLVLIAAGARLRNWQKQS